MATKTTEKKIRFSSCRKTPSTMNAHKVMIGIENEHSQARSGPSPDPLPSRPVSLYAQCAATPSSAMRCISVVRIWTSTRSPDGPTTQADCLGNPGSVTLTNEPGVIWEVDGVIVEGNSTYTAILRGGSTDPRVKDLAGNALAADYTWSFTTSAGTP